MTCSLGSLRALENAGPVGTPVPGLRLKGSGATVTQCTNGTPGNEVNWR